MDKIVFLATLAGKLSEYPMSPEDIEKSVASVKGFLDRISDVDFAAEPPTDQDAADMAKELYEKHLAEQQALEEALKASPEEVTEEEVITEAETPTEAPYVIEAAEDNIAKEPAPVEETEPIFVEQTEAVPVEESEPEAVEETEPELIEETQPAFTELTLTKEEEQAILAQVFSEPAEEAPEATEPVVEAEAYIPDDEPPAPEEILEQLDADKLPPAEPAISSDEAFFEMLAKEAETERVDQARIEELELKALAMANKEEPEVVAQVLSQDEKLVEIVANSDIAEEFDPIETAFDPTQRPDIAFEESELTRVFSQENDDSKEFKITQDKLKKVDESEVKSRKAKKEPREKVPGSPAFWTLFILTLPLTLPILAVICSLFGVAYVAITALIVAVCAVMLAVIAGGTALALIGIIYGVTQCFTTVPIGLYEIGLGIVIGGVTMLVSVLLKNVGFNYIPKLYGLLNRFAAYVFNGIGNLYTKTKKECGKKK